MVYDKYCIQITAVLCVHLRQGDSSARGGILTRRKSQLTIGSGYMEIPVRTPREAIESNSFLGKVATAPLCKIILNSCHDLPLWNCLYPCMHVGISQRCLHENNTEKIMSQCV